MYQLSLKIQVSLFNAKYDSVLESGWSDNSFLIDF